LTSELIIWTVEGLKLKRINSSQLIDTYIDNIFVEIKVWSIVQNTEG